MQQNSIAVKILLTVFGGIALFLFFMSSLFLGIFGAFGANTIITSDGAIPSNIVAVSPVPQADATKALVALGQTFVALLFNLSMYYQLIVGIALGVIGICWIWSEEINGLATHLKRIQITFKDKKKGDL